MKIELQNFRKSFGSTVVINNMNLTINDGEMVALLGQSGCGKSTTLFCICGIHRINGGQILFGDIDVSDTPAQKRNVGVVFQNYALYPHMTIWDNIAFPLKVQGIKKQDQQTLVQEIAELVHIEQLLDRRPAQLSGGQQQRVALARALVRKPDVLLLDEPLANLDAKLRLEMRTEIRRIQQETGITAVLVTHDQIEAMSMCDRIALMHNGAILQLSTPTEMYNKPKDAFVANFLGTPPIRFVQGQIIGNDFVFCQDYKLTNIDTQKYQFATKVGIRPEYFGPQFGDTVKGTISFVEMQGREDLFDVTLSDGTVLRSVLPAGNTYKLGDRVRWGIQTDKILFFNKNDTTLF